VDAVHVIDHALLLVQEVANDLGQAMWREPTGDADALGQIVDDGVVKLDSLRVPLHPS
jgi:hypothetical protein